MLRANSNASTPLRRPGSVVVTVAFAMITLLAIVALSLDGGFLMDKRRQAQGAADAAALAATGELYANWWVGGSKNRGLDVGGSARQAALATAAANGYVDGVDGCQVTVNIPPTSGPFTGMPGHAEVLISDTQPRYFSKVFGDGDISYGARAVARGKRGMIRQAIICLDLNGKGALNAGGNGMAIVEGAPIQVNSSHTEAMIGNGNGSLAADEFLVNGTPGWSTPGGGSFSGPITSGSEQIPDPLAHLPVPDINSLTVQSTKKTSISGNRTVTLQPGVYKGGIQMTGGDVTLAPGIYYLDGGGFSVGAQAKIRGEGVMIYNAPLSSSDVINISAGGSCILSPMMDGAYQGILVFQDRNSTNTVSVTGSPGATFKISGTFYAANGLLKITGNGDQQTLGSQYISHRLELGGNGNYYCSWTAEMTPGVREIFLVQ